MSVLRLLVVDLNEWVVEKRLEIVDDPMMVVEVVGLFGIPEGEQFV